MKNNTIGSSFDDFLIEEGISEEVEACAIKKIIACQLQQAIEKEHLSKTTLAAQLKTSRAAVNRLLDPENESITLFAASGSIPRRTEGTRSAAAFINLTLKYMVLNQMHYINFLAERHSAVNRQR